MTEPLPKEKYAELVGDAFHIGLPDDTVLDMTLIEVSRAGPQTTKQAQEIGKPVPFSLLFRGPADPILPQSIYRLSHAVLGELDLFLVPIGPEGEGMGYESVFN